MSRKHEHRSQGHTNYSFLVKFIVALIFLVIAIVFLKRQEPVSVAPRVSSPADAQFSSSSYVKWVVDGDTVGLSNGEKVRYLGIDTPETHIFRNGHFADDPKPFGPEAAEFNRKLVQGKAVTLEYDVERLDKYKRTLAYVYVDGLFVNAELVKNGYACVFIKSPNVKHADELIKLQREARLAQRGMWGAVDKINAADAVNYIDQIRLVTGKVIGAKSSSNALFLNLGVGEHKDFTVLIYKDALKYFKYKGIDPVTYYRDKTIEVSGRIHEYNGPEIIVGYPGEIDIIE